MQIKADEDVVRTNVRSASENQQLNPQQNQLERVQCEKMNKLFCYTHFPLRCNICINSVRYYASKEEDVLNANELDRDRDREIEKLPSVN